MDDSNNTTADNSLEEDRASTSQPVGDNSAEEDNDTPASLPTDMPDDDLPIDHPSIDSNVDPDEAYQEGEDNAAANNK